MPLQLFTISELREKMPAEQFAQLQIIDGLRRDLWGMQLQSGEISELTHRVYMSGRFSFGETLDETQTIDYEGDPIPPAEWISSRWYLGSMEWSDGRWVDSDNEWDVEQMLREAVSTAKR